MTGRAHALLVLRVFFHVMFSCVSSLKISQVNAQSRHVSRCPHTQDMPPGVWGQVTRGWAVKSTQAGRWRADCEVWIRLLGTLMATASIMAFIVWRLSHRDIPASTFPFISNNPLSGWHWEWAAFIIQALNCLPCQYWYWSFQVLSCCLIIFLFVSFDLSVKNILSEDFFFFHCKEPFVQWKGPSWNHWFLTEDDIWGTM